MKRAVIAFGRFWWDFLVGDTPELFVGTLVALGAAYALHREWVAAVVLVPLFVISLLVLSTWRGRSR